MKSAFYMKSALPLTNSSEWVCKYLTVYSEQIRNKTSFGHALNYAPRLKDSQPNVPVFVNPVIDLSMFERIRFQDGLPRVLIHLFSLLSGD